MTDQPEAPAFRLVIIAHAWERYEQRVRAHMSPNLFLELARDALDFGQLIELKAREGEFCRMYRRFALVYRLVGDEMRLLTVLPRGVRPKSEVRDDD